MSEYRPKSFWKRPEGKTGLGVMIALLIGGGLLVGLNLPLIVGAMQNVLALSVMLLVLAAVVYMVLDPKMRNLIWYMYKSVMRWVTGIFVQIDPIGILKSYVDDLQGNLRKMNKQISQLRGQMHKLREQIHNNKRQIESPCY